MKKSGKEEIVKINNCINATLGKIEELSENVKLDIEHLPGNGRIKRIIIMFAGIVSILTLHELIGNLLSWTSGTDTISGFIFLLNRNSWISRIIILLSLTIPVIHYYLRLSYIPRYMVDRREGKVNAIRRIKMYHERINTCICSIKKLNEMVTQTLENDEVNTAEMALLCGQLCSLELNCEMRSSDLKVDNGIGLFLKRYCDDIKILVSNMDYHARQPLKEVLADYNAGLTLFNKTGE